MLPRRWGVIAFVLAACNAVARVYLGAHNPLDVVGGVAIAAVLDLVLDVAGGPARTPRPGRAAPPEARQTAKARPFWQRSSVCLGPRHVH
ncbi:MAG TPA: phosphatase PAP2 family protein [Streptosporangiaceae bacterium]